MRDRRLLFLFLLLGGVVAPPRPRRDLGGGDFESRMRWLSFCVDEVEINCR